MPSLAVGVAAGIAAGVWKRSVFAGLMTSYLVAFVSLILVSAFASLYIRLRFSARTTSLAAERACPVYHADNAKSIERANSVRCPACHGEALRFSMGGKS